MSPLGNRFSVSTFQELTTRENDSMSHSSFEVSPVASKEVKERSNRMKKKLSLGMEDHGEDLSVPKVQSGDSHQKLVMNGFRPCLHKEGSWSVL